jgi:hypothetical protein
MIYFNIQLTPSIKSSIKQKLGLDLNKYSSIPMRWVKGDTPSHIDKGEHKFSNTYLIYLNNSEGELIIGETSYPIQSNNGFVFQEGIFHKTTNTGNKPRLMMGPMNELAEPVGLVKGFTIPIQYIVIFFGVILYILYRGISQLYNTYSTSPEEISNRLKKYMLIATILTIMTFYIDKSRSRKCDGITAYEYAEMDANSELSLLEPLADSSQDQIDYINNINKDNAERITNAKKRLQELSEFKNYTQVPGYCNSSIPKNNIYISGILVFTILFVLSSIMLKQYNTKWIIIGYILLTLANKLFSIQNLVLASIQSIIS